MGLLDRFRTKKERLYVDPETKETKWVPTERVREKRGDREVRELTHEEQFPAKRKQPWQTERGKRVIKSIGGGVKRVDKAVVGYNRTRNPIGRQPVQRSSSYSTRDNYNPFGSLFDTGMNYDKPAHKKTKSSSGTKYAVVGGKAYPIASTGKKKKKKSSGRKTRSNDWDVFDAFGGYKF